MTYRVPGLFRAQRLHPRAKQEALPTRSFHWGEGRCVVNRKRGESHCVLQTFHGEKRTRVEETVIGEVSGWFFVFCLIEVKFP